MLIDRLTVSQNDVRHDYEHLMGMVGYVKSGGLFTRKAIEAHAVLTGSRPDPPLIGITRFPDGVHMIHDGHNRVVACHWAGRTELDPDEYFVKEYGYEHYTDLEPENGWFTPFDPRTEVRLADFGKYKVAARLCYANNPDLLNMFVGMRKHWYCSPRDVVAVAEMADRLLLKFGSHKDVCEGRTRVRQLQHSGTGRDGPVPDQPQEAPVVH